ncbi:acetyl-CoA decarbonylase/synthase complex subunit delta [Methanofollis ethanolicus]|uniref:acetyl-CoA decarbonylase/synthase complex subunit delta n=1 Tax=Methanofollis ethanolicus TaxID=488124 RepID=UPI000829F0ED|nr:acetyl-CoA decarbonylase/synthase complex subunit delta [Methanofollis ethanolicus]
MTERITEVAIGATRAEGGTRTRSYRVGGASALPDMGDAGARPLVALEICDDPALWPAVVLDEVGDLAGDLAGWAKAAEERWGADLVRLVLTSTRRRGFDDPASAGRAVEEVLAATGLPLIVEGSIDPALDTGVFRRCGEAGEGERLLLGTAEAERYRSVAAAALAYGHAVVAQTPIDINLAKQLNILLRETGVPHDRIVIDPYTGALGYGFEYSYSVMERVRTAALAGDADLAMPMISAAQDSLTVKEVREAPEEERAETAVQWEFYAAFAAAVAGAGIVCVRHPRTVGVLREAIADLWGGEGWR